MFDAACREEKMVELADVEDQFEIMKKRGNIVQRNTKFKTRGLFNFQGERRRRLNTSDNLKIGGLNGSIQLGSNTMLEGDMQPLKTQIGGVTKISPDSLDLLEDTEVDNESFNYGVYYRGTDGNTTSSEAEETLSNHLQLRSQCAMLNNIDPCDDDYLSKTGTITPPTLSRNDDYTLTLDCTEYPQLASAWEAKLKGSDSNTVRRRRDRRFLEANGGQETLLDRQIIELVRKKILDGTLPVTIVPGNVQPPELGEDVYTEIRR